MTDKVPANDELFYINGSQGKLAAKISLPLLEASQKCPMVILSHGFGGDMTFHLWEPIIKILNENGIGVLRYDFNGCGQSEGEFQNMTVLNEIEDLLCVISYVRSLSVTENISLVGHSQGGVVTSMVSGDCGDKQIKCEVLLSAAAVLREDAIRGNNPIIRALDKTADKFMRIKYLSVEEYTFFWREGCADEEINLVGQIIKPFIVIQQTSVNAALHI